MKKIILILILLLVGMEGLSWLALKNNKSTSNSTADTPATPTAVFTVQATPQTTQTKEDGVPAGSINSAKLPQTATSSPVGGGDLASFPPPTVEKLNGVVQRTIHMGVRQWAWDPAEIKVNYGEKVILIMHNADVPHSISIPDLNVNSAIPEEGAIVTFTASKKGTFDFFCDTPCGKGHSQMRGKITVS
jgi:cytochrome c oxidase subunit 2